MVSLYENINTYVQWFGHVYSITTMYVCAIGDILDLGSSSGRVLVMCFIGQYMPAILDSLRSAYVSIWLP